MIRDIHDITLKDVFKLLENKTTRQFLKYKWLPLFFFQTKIETLTNNIIELINNEKKDYDRDFYQVIALRRIQILNAIWNGIKLELEMRATVKSLLGMKEESKQLAFFLAKAKELTKIDIESTNDLGRLEKHITGKENKYKEMFPPQQEEENEEGQPTFGQIVFVIFLEAKQNYNINMRLVDFISMRKETEKRFSSKTKRDE